MRIREVAKVTGKKGTAWLIQAIEAGMSANRRNYTEKALRKAVPLFENAPVFTDHPTDNEEQERPERSIRDKVGVLRDAVYEGDGVQCTLLAIDPWFREAMTAAWDLGERNFIEFSINATGFGNDRDDGAVDITELTKVHSVDAVTQGAAGGKVMSLLAGQRRDKKLSKKTNRQYLDEAFDRLRKNEKRVQAEAEALTAESVTKKLRAAYLHIGMSEDEADWLLEVKPCEEHVDNAPIITESIMRQVREQKEAQDKADEKLREGLRRLYVLDYGEEPSEHELTALLHCR